MRSSGVRQAEVRRESRETKIYVSLTLMPGSIKVSTPVKFLNHMLETLIFYMNASAEVIAEDLRGFDDHHVVEDVFITLGTAIDRALGDRVGIRRFGWSMVPMDDALALTAVDLGGRAYWVFRGSFIGERIGDLTTQMIPHIIRTLAIHSRATIHAEIRWGENDHHMAEALFKSLGMSMAMAMEYVDNTVRSLKGTMQ
ncbi:imidazoleglycerol-phosphate dehydratase [Vulcanisaeta sp. JCM 16159]|uniref:imidazoleglycerol-phosphate dehydratase n=1 Tax=Vulcanisaeta sp. JCM 16159 TaxID=1295371 RepID=UPI001FB4E5D8|nr:imidazoleglycerol-phosphate dehydratase [Vulcanisaeta sp. JCM 16159]